MKYDFTTIIDRKGKDALAVDALGKNPGFGPEAPKEGFDAIPMWIADMNFAVVPTVQEEIIKRVNHPCFGYFSPRDEYYDSIIDWHKERNNVQDLRKENIGYENGVLGGVISALNVFCSKGDKVLVHSPTYIGFTFSLKDNGYDIVHSPLYRDEEGVWRMDYEDMEKKIKENKIHAAIMCNPHNPCGRCWSKEELEKAYEIFEKYNVYVVSDEIWSDIMLNGHKHTTSQSVSKYAKEHTAAFYAPSKTFSLAGLIGSYHIIYNQWIKDRIDKESALSHYNSMNVLSMYGLIGAYKNEGKEWVDELLEVLSNNINYACDYIKENFKGVSVFKPEATYMLFLDCKEYCEKHGIDDTELLQRGYDVGVAWQDGRPFGGDYTIRMNLALPYSRVEEAFERLSEYVFI